MKTEIINALLAGRKIQVNENPLNRDSEVYWVDLNIRNKNHYYLYASLFTDKDDYPLFRIKPQSKSIDYKSALLKNSEEGYWIFTVNSPEKAASLEKEHNFVKWITHWKTYNIEDNTCEK